MPDLPQLDAVTASWAVWRQDDNGNRVEITRVTSRGDAEGIARAFEDRGHKQLYWVEAVSGPRD